MDSVSMTMTLTLHNYTTRKTDRQTDRQRKRERERNMSAQVPFLWYITVNKKKL